MNGKDFFNIRLESTGFKNIKDLKIIFDLNKISVSKMLKCGKGKWEMSQLTYGTYNHYETVFKIGKY